MDHFPVTKKKHTELKKKKGWKGMLLSLFQKKDELHTSLPLKSFDSQFSACLLNETTLLHFNFE